jgi:von Willebrand factor type A domain/Aerotolerance regulator N-terminal
MGFLNLLLAGFAGAAAIPIIIHLLNQRRFKVVVWAAMDFLLATIEKNSRRLQLQDLILMLLRAFALVFLALALARPTLTPGGLDMLGRQGETAAVIVLDNSLSMGHRSGNESRFDAAKRAALAIVDHLPKGAGAALVLMSDVAVDEIPEPSHDAAFVRAAIQDAVLSDGGTDVAGGINKAWSILKDAKALAKEVYVVSDMQGNAWPASGDAGWTTLSNELTTAKPAVRLYLANVSDGADSNLSIAALMPVDEQVSTESDAAFVATLQNHGGGAATNVTVELLVGAPDAPLNEPLRVAASVVVDKVDGTAQVRLETRFAGGGDYRIAVRAAPDRLPADDTRSLALPVVERIKVLVIDGQPGDGGTFNGAGDFLKAALSPRDPNDEANKALIDTEVITVAQLGERSLRDYQAVILANVADLPTGLVEGLKTYVKAEGRGLIIFGGDNVSSVRYNQLLGGKDGLLPGLLAARQVEPDVAPNGEEPGFGFATTDLGHPVVSFFSDKDSQPFLAAPRFTRALGIDIDTKDLAPLNADPKTKAKPDDVLGDNKVNIVAKFTGGQPAIAERLAGRGRVLLFACTADRDWGDLPLRPAFLMLARRAVQHVAEGHRLPRTLQVNDPLIELVGIKAAGAQVTVRDPRGGARTVAAVPTPAGDLARIDFADTRFSGFYHVSRAAGAGTGNSGDATISTMYAANPPRGESNLDALDEAGVRALYPTLDFTWLDGRGEVASAIDGKRVGREIWPLLFILACACLIAESVLALRWAPKGG